MAKSNALFQLIKSLDPNEKRHFKLGGTADGTKGQKNYQELFEVLSRMEQYDEEVVVRQLSNPTFAKNLSAGKNYLYGLILKSLRGYHSGSRHKSAQIELAESWIDIHLLLDKGLFSQGLKLIARARKLCKRYHFNHDLLKLNLLERVLRNAFERKNTIQTMRALQEEGSEFSTEALADLESFSAYETVFIHIKNKDPEEVVKRAIAEGWIILKTAKTNKETCPSGVLSTTIIYRPINANTSGNTRPPPATWRRSCNCTIKMKN